MKKVYGIFLSMLVLTFVPVLMVALGFDVVSNESNTLVWVALSVAVLMIGLLACTFFPCNARKSQRKYINRFVPFNFIFLYIFVGAMAYLLCRLSLKTMKKDEEDGSLIILQAMSMTVGLSIGLTSFALVH